MVEITVHRGSREIGGNCVELRHSSGERLILDVGRPLDVPTDAVGLMPKTLRLDGDAAVLISHSHQDHWGLVNDLPTHWPVWTGAATAKLIGITARLARNPLNRVCQTWATGTAFSIGPFRITPILTDHSAFDATMLLIETDGRRILYSGDFRRHGRKAALVERLMHNPPLDVDLLILEGTNLGTDKPVIPETSLETQFTDLMARKKGRIFVSWSGQNIDRTVTLYRAARRSGRDLVIDLYTAEVLEAVADGTRLPRPGFDNLKIVLTRGLRNHYKKLGREDFLERMARTGISASKLEGSRHVVMARDGLIPDYVAKGVVATPDDALVWSMWRGYLKENSPTQDWFRPTGQKIDFLHTSGHASTEDLLAFAQAVQAKRVIPVHGANWVNGGVVFENLHPVADGEVVHV